MDVKEAEAKLNKGLADAGRVYVEAVESVENKFHASRNTADTAYRETMANNRKVYNQALLKAETEFNEANKKADDIYRDSPVKAQADYDGAKTKARLDYEATKTRLHDEYQKAISTLGLGTADLRRS